MQKIMTFLYFAALCTTACTDAKEPLGLNPVPVDSIKTIRYLALGDSYTIGHGVGQAERFPEQLADSLLLQKVFTQPLLIAKTGWTTADLQAAINAAQIAGQTFDLVTLLIGVNNQYRGYPIGEYEQQFTQLLDQAIGFAGGQAQKVFVLSIPDYAFTPFGQQSQNPALISGQIDAYNALNKAISLQRGARYVDITPISRQGLADPSLVAPDQLHPSGKMYAQWVGMFYKEIIP